MAGWNLHEQVLREAVAAQRANFQIVHTDRNGWTDVNTDMTDGISILQRSLRDKKKKWPFSIIRNRGCSLNIVFFP